MLEYGPKDTCWAANWSNEYLLRKYFVRSATLGRENNPMIIAFFDQLERSWNDHIGMLQIDSQRFDITDIAKTTDIPTIQGIQHWCKNIILGGLSPGRYHGVGNSTIEPRCYQQRLYAETEPRADMSISAQGSRTRVNESLRFIGIFPASFPTITVRESAVFTDVTGYSGIMFNRQVFSGGANGVPITHTAGASPFTVATSIDFTSVTTWG